MEILFATCLYNLELTSDVPDPVRIFENTFLTRDQARIRSLITKSEHRRIIGQLEYMAFLASNAVVYSQAALSENTAPESFLIAKLYQIESFQTCLWLVKDNAINDETGFLFNTKPPITACSNSLYSLFTNHRGDKDTTQIDSEALARATKLFDDHITDNKSSIIKPKSQLTKMRPRVVRALYLVPAARSESDLTLKIASYCSSLETLFSTNQVELSHQLSERVAYFLCETASERLDMYRKLKRAYAFRSKVVHGATVNEKDFDELTSTCEFLDNICRALITRLLSDTEEVKKFSGDNQQLEEHLLKMVLGHAP
jgi:hypothetical protein